MNRKRFRLINLIAIAVAVISLTGCGAFADFLYDETKGLLLPEEIQEPIIEKIDSDVETEYAYSKSDTTVTKKELDELKDVPKQTANEKRKECEGLYYFNLLSPEDKDLYSEIFAILTELGEDVKVSTLDEEAINRTFTFVMNDHPELFYVDGYNFKKYMVNDKLQSISFTGSYTMSPEEIVEDLEKIDAYTENFMSFLYSGIDTSDDYNVIKFAYEYIILGTDYVRGSANNQNITSVMINGQSVCQGYAKTFQYLMNKCGIETTLVTGTVKKGESHAWNLVKCNGEYYYTDVTWGDASYTLSDKSSKYANSLPPVNYNYLLITTDEMAKNHILSNEELFPVCTAFGDNYFIRENLLFTGIDEAQLSAVFEKGYAVGSEFVTLKFNSVETYDSMHDYLLKEQNIFTYLRGNTTVSFAEGRDDLYMIFWISNE